MRCHALVPTLLLVVMSIGGCRLQAPRTDVRPNILLVLSDDQSAEHVGVYGNPVIQTPNLDRFASQGMRFERAYVTASQCSPSRASIFTGLYPQRIHMTRLHAPLPPEYETFPEMLRTLGYHTGICGRHNHMGGYASDGSAIDSLFKRLAMRTMADRVDVLMDTTFSRHEVVRQVERFLSSRPVDRPFFLQASFHEPHRRWGRGGIESPHEPDSIVVPAELPDIPEVRREIADYYDAVSRMDESFGAIVRVLEANGLEENTMVVFLGDNGYAMPRGKMTLYHAGTHVPLLIRWPGHADSGSSTKELVSSIDLAATFLDVAGGRLPENREGVSLVPVLDGEEGNSRDYVFASRGWHVSFDMQRSVTSDRYLLIMNALPERAFMIGEEYGSRPFGRAIDSMYHSGVLPEMYRKFYFAETRPEWELYDLEADPRQLSNLAGQSAYARIEDDLKYQLAAWMERNYDYLKPPW